MNPLMTNPALKTDSYKAGHYKQYPLGTTHVMSYLEARGDGSEKTVFFGLQYVLMRHFVGRVITQEMLDEATKFWSLHFGRGDIFNREGWQYIIDTYQGKLPIAIHAVREGTPVNTSNVLVRVTNTDPKCWWLTNWLETLLVQVWYPTTVATNSREIKKILASYLEETGDPSLLPFKLHDFGYRGVSCDEQAGIGGMSHLVNFQGTDNVKGIVYAATFYKSGMCGHSIPASEHSTMTSWGKEHELDAFKNMLDINPTGLVACVSDSYDIYHACEQYWGTDLKDQIMSRDGCLVVRPDSGDPVEVTLKVFDILWDKFGGVTNEKGYRVLDPHIRMIQGDGIDKEMVRRILENFKVQKISADNIAFGSGGGLLQQFSRDTYRFAFKCCQVVVNGEACGVSKSPIAGSKPSKAGDLALFVTPDGSYTTIAVEAQDKADQLELVFLNGELMRFEDFETVRKAAEI